jgi:membrane protease subunit (stomatin/prohibitin family)
MIGQRTRAALEREKTLALRAIKELEFDRAMGKLSDSDWQEMSARLRARAARLIRQLDAGGGYRDQIERELAKRLADQPAPAAVRGAFCTECGTKNEADAKFCKNCGHKL